MELVVSYQIWDMHVATLTYKYNICIPSLMVELEKYLNAPHG